MSVTKDQIRRHLKAKGCKEDKYKTSYVLKENGHDLRVVLKERVFRIEEGGIAENGDYKFRRLYSGKYKKVSIKDGKFVGLEK